MPKKIRFQLALADGTKAGSLEALKKHFDLESVISYYNSGDLLTWLRDRNIEAEADAVEALDATAPDFQEKLCTIFGAAYVGPIDMEELASRQKRIERLRKYTDDDAIIKNINSVAFDQEELTDLLDADLKEIYLCGDNFSIPVSLKGKTYIGVNQPHVRISGKSQEQELSGINVIDCIMDGVKKESETSTVSISNSESSLSDCITSKKIADEIFRILAPCLDYRTSFFNLYKKDVVESDDYFLYFKSPMMSSNRIFGALWMLTNLDDANLYAVSKSSAKESLMLDRMNYPYKVPRNSAKWTAVNNSVIAYFSDDTIGSSYVYIIDIPNLKITPLDFSIDPSECIGTNGNIFIQRNNNRKTYCIDAKKRKKYPLHHEAYDECVAFAETSVYFVTNSSDNHKVLVEYDFIKNRERLLAQLPDYDECVAISYYKGRILLCLDEDGYGDLRDCRIGYVDLMSYEECHYQGIVDEICIHAYSLKASRDSWIFIAEQPENTLHFFDFEKMKLTTVAEDCNDFLCKIGKWIYFEQGEENTKAKVSIERPMSVELLGEDL